MKCQEFTFPLATDKIFHLSSASGAQYNHQQEEMKNIFGVGSTLSLSWSPEGGGIFGGALNPPCVVVRAKAAATGGVPIVK